MSTPKRNVLNPNDSLVLERSLTLNKTRRDVRKSFMWGSFNFLIFSILLYDIANSCPLRYDIYDYGKHALLFIIGINLLYYAAKIMISNFNQQLIPITLEQKRLLGISDSDPNFKVISPINTPTIQSPVYSFSSSPGSSPSLPSTSTPMNTTALSWRSNLSQNDSLNYSLSSPSWTYHKVASDPNMSTFSSNSPISNIQYKDTSGIEFISDEKDLDKYLKDFEVNSSVKNLNNQTQQTSNLLSSFWSHPVTKTAKDMSSFLRRCAYQLSAQSPGLNTSSPKNKIENKISPQTSALAPWTRINVDIVVLTQWNENLRKWVSQTILERLVREFDRINESFEKHGLTDIKIGSVGLDRLRKTAQIAHVTHFIPSLPTLIPFLEITSNQEYLEKRIRELAKGGCMSEFRWHSGSSYNGKEWDESLPTDSAIIMHLLASYLDTQLMPLPSMPDTKPFSGIYYIKCKDKLPPLTPTSLFIQQVSEKPPHYRVIVGTTVFDMVKGYNNLFHCILFFLYHVNQREHGMLGRVNLGRAGVNMLWIIGQ